MDPNVDQRRRGEHHADDNINTLDPSRTAGVGVQVNPQLLERESWLLRRAELNAANGPSNEEADAKLVELTVLCAHNLKDVRLFSSMSPRAELYIDKRFPVITSIAFNGGTSPYWNNAFWFKIDDACFGMGHLSIEIYDWSFFSEHRLIGTVRMPLAHLSGSSWTKQFFSYEVQVPSSGPCQGIVQISLRRVRKAIVQMASHSIHEPWKIFRAGSLECPYP